MTEKVKILFANDAFYLAFQNNDIEAMTTLWANRDDISCIHPGWNHLSGRDLVLASWDDILSGNKTPNFEIKGASVNIYENIAIVICYELFEKICLVATNIFVNENKEWRIIHHQSSASPPPEVIDNSEPIETLQ
ncbi:MAG: DUF4440 domain-containing protein [Rhodospirillaceae bacterium]|nr:DUF4440 domain-containing protein [Rhodospirillaceae bacterium]OUT80730.1 MAG: hypothetical protein CBB83_00625 [Rhodospirillaceae bacterium TMED23]|tara:strand:+ start:17 stop:421 length:405 start_codon:yes stop_codon:yes gene_type:complete